MHMQHPWICSFSDSSCVLGTVICHYSYYSNSLLFDVDSTSSRYYHEYCVVLFTMW